MAIHTFPHPLADRPVTLIENNSLGIPTTEIYMIEDWWDSITGHSWQIATGNPAALEYSLRIANTSIPLDDEVVYGKLKGLGILIHVSEIASIA